MSKESCDKLFGPDTEWDRTAWIVYLKCCNQRHEAPTLDHKDALELAELLETPNSHYTKPETSIDASSDVRYDAEIGQSIEAGDSLKQPKAQEGR